MASNSITSWQIDREKMETVADFIFLGSRIMADGDCSHEINRCLLLGRRPMTNLDSILKKQRHPFANKGPSSQSYGFSSSHVMDVVTISVILEPPKIKSLTVSIISPSIYHEVMRPDAMILVF